ncbi:MAG TPA: FMN-binding protein [Elusimicrobiota bacterium]|nr:FMN-binding protein [Elusimicrobiota bacterium]
MECLFVALLIVSLGCGWLEAKFYVDQQQAIQQTFPASARVARKTLFLTQAQTERIQHVARARLDSSIITYYVGESTGGVVGTVFFDRRTVRTMLVTYMVVVTPQGAVDHVEVLSFDEPDDYLPPLRWLGLYKGRRLDDDLSIGRGIPRMTGATLSSQAMNDGIRLCLAIYDVAIKGAAK